MPIVGRCPHFLEPGVSSCFVNTGASHVEARKANRLIVQGSCILRMHYMWMSAKQFFTMIFIPVMEHAPTLRHSMLCFIFPFLFMYGQNDFLHSTVNEVASMAAILVQKLCGFFFFFSQNNEKSSQVIKNPCFVLNHLIYIFSIYT